MTLPNLVMNDYGFPTLCPRLDHWALLL